MLFVFQRGNMVHFENTNNYGEKTSDLQLARASTFS